MKIKWYQKNENLVLIGALGAGLMAGFPSHTIAYNFGASLTAITGFLLGKTGLSDAKKYGTPSGLSKAASYIAKGVKSLAKK